jgi:hypothetical protein
MSFKFHATARREAATDACNSDRNMEILLQNPKPLNPTLNPPPSNLDQHIIPSDSKRILPSHILLHHSQTKKNTNIEDTI